MIKCDASPHTPNSPPPNPLLKSGTGKPRSRSGERETDLFVCIYFYTECYLGSFLVRDPRLTEPVSTCRNIQWNVDYGQSLFPLRNSRTKRTHEQVPKSTAGRRNVTCVYASSSSRTRFRFHAACSLACIFCWTIPERKESRLEVQWNSLINILRKKFSNLH